MKIEIYPDPQPILELFKNNAALQDLQPIIMVEHRDKHLVFYANHELYYTEINKDKPLWWPQKVTKQEVLERITEVCDYKNAIRGAFEAIPDITKKPIKVGNQFIQQKYCMNYLTNTIRTCTVFTDSDGKAFEIPYKLLGRIAEVNEDNKIKHFLITDQGKQEISPAKRQEIIDWDRQ